MSSIIPDVAFTRICFQRHQRQKPLLLNYRIIVSSLFILIVVAAVAI